jgi:hypothetical protein
MAFTDNCDLFGAVDEQGINLVVRHVMRQRPSLFNYGTDLFLSRPDLLCVPIEATPDVRARGNPLFTLEDPIPILGTDNRFGVHFCFQLTRLEVDFHPGSVFTLPPELSPPLKAQRFAFHVQVCGGLGCPPKDFLNRAGLQLPYGDRTAGHPAGRTTGNKDPREGRPDPNQKEKDRRDDRPDPKQPQPTPLPTDGLDCFCLDLFAVGHFEIEGAKGTQQFLVGRLDGLEIVDIEPKGMENSIECYLKLLVQLVILPRLRLALEKITFEILDGLATITLFATPISAKVPHNPAVEDDKLKVFVSMEVS